MNFGDLVILLMIGCGMAGLAGFTVYEYFERKDDRANEQRNGTTDYWTNAPTPRPGVPKAEAADRSESRSLPKRHDSEG
jgi:hypothetical protein